MGVAAFARALSREIKWHFEKEDVADMIVREYGSDSLERIRLLEILGGLGFEELSAEEIVLLLGDRLAIDEPVVIAAERSGFTSRKSSEGQLGIHSNGFSMRMDKDSNCNSKELRL